MERRRHRHVRAILAWFAGPAQYPLQQLQLLLMVVTALYLMLTASFNLYAGVGEPVYSFAMLAMACLVSALWYVARWRGYVYQATIGVLGILSGVLLPAIYFANGGISGPVLLYAIVVATYAYGVLNARSLEKLALLGLLTVLPICLMWLEYQYPQWIYQYQGLGVQMLDLWVSYFLCLTLLVLIIASHVRRFNQELRRAQHLAEKLERQASLDGLTGIYNHKAIFAQARAALASAGPVSVIIFDLDFFKQINDTYGHPFGDEVLVNFAKVLSEQAGTEVGRIGGEEFLMLCQVDHHQALEQLLNEVAKQWQGVDLDSQPITFSAGVAVRKPNDTLESVWQRADEALYLAKRAGRNQWQIAC